jgi:multidrug resistance efflux pump
MKKTPLFIIIAALAIVSLTACSTADAETAATPEPVIPEVVTIAEGRLLPVNWLDQSFTLPGTVESVLVSNGEQVKAGQPLVALVESPEVLLAVARAEEEVLAAQHALDSLLARAELSLAQAELKVFNAQEALDDAQADYNANASDENRIELDIAAASLALAEAELARVQDGSGVDTDVLNAAEARLASAKAALASAHSKLDANILTAKMAAMVTDLDLQPGQQVAAGAPVVTIADLSHWVVKTDNLTEFQVSALSTGDQVEVVLDAFPGVKLTGEVVRINARYVEKRGDITYTVTIALNENDPALRWGMTAAVYFKS